jgi:protein-disulfide isomerase
MNQSKVPRLAVPVNERDHSLGPPIAPVTLVEYGDFECPYCRAAHYIILDILTQVGDDLRYVFRNFPLVEIHPHAEQAAEAAEAAGAQGKYWEMHHQLFENQPALDLSDLIGYAQNLGLDAPRFERDLIDQRFGDRVLEDLISGARSGVSGTPTFFINGRRYEDSYDEATLLGALERAAGTGGTRFGQRRRAA